MAERENVDATWNSGDIDNTIESNTSIRDVKIATTRIIRLLCKQIHPLREYRCLHFKCYCYAFIFKFCSLHNNSVYFMTRVTRGMYYYRSLYIYCFVSHCNRHTPINQLIIRKREKKDRDNASAFISVTNAYAIGGCNRGLEWSPVAPNNDYLIKSAVTQQK